MSDRHNGWANYETRCVNLWMQDDEESYDFWARAAERAPDAYELARWMRAHAEDKAPEVGGFWQDLLSAALSEVDWQEIAERPLRSTAAESANAS